MPKQFCPQTPMKKRILFLLISFCSGVAYSATFTSQASGPWSTPATWTIVGPDADGIPDSGDDVIINGGFAISLAVVNNNCRDFTISSGSLTMNNRTLRFYGNCTKTGGSIVGNGPWQFYGNPATITGVFTNSGNWYFNTGSAVTIATGSTIQKNNGFTIYTNATVTNNGTVRFTGGSLTFNTSTSAWINAANSLLQVAANITGPGVLNCSASPNTMVYGAAATTSIRGQTYHHLIIQNSLATSPVLAGNITVNGNLTLTATTLNCSNRNITLAGNWVNNANTTCTNQALISFTGSGIQTITRATGNTETFNNVDLNGSGTVRLNDTLRVNGSLNINSGTLDVNAGNFAIRCLGNFVDGSAFMARQGTVFMMGSSAQTIDGISSTVFYNLHCSNAAGVTINFSKAINNILTVSAGAFGPSGFGGFTLLASGSTTCARIAPLGVGASLVGSSWSVETYIDGPATAYWQYLTPPMSSPTLQDWDGDTRFYMSGTGGNDGNACCPTFFSVRTYNTATNTYSNVTSINTVLTPGRGYMVWMSDNLNSLTAPLIFDTRGTPNFNTVNRAVVAGGAGGGYNLVGNPYACPVTFASVVAASSATLNPNFLILREDGSYATNPNSGTIAAAQGFMCVASTAGNITFTETCKSTTATPNVMRVLPGNMVRIKAGNQVNGIGEETTVQLDPSGSESYDAFYDLPYLPSPYENATHIWTGNADGNQFILNNTGTTQDHLFIPVSVITSTPGVQTLTFKDLNTVTEYNCAWLEDLTTGARVNLNAQDIYTFEENEMGATRNFILHFERTNDCTFDLQNSVASLDAQTNVFVNSGQIFATFEFTDETPVEISMYDLSGRMVMGQTTMNVSSQTVALENPDAHGIYLVRIVRGNEVTTKKIYY